MNEHKIRSGLRNFITHATGPFTLLAQVSRVDTKEMTCVLYDEETEASYYDVRLRPVTTKAQAFVLFPKVGAWCLAVRIEEDDEWFVVGCSECDKIVFNNGTNGGIVNWPEAKKQLDKTNDVVAALVKAFTNWTPVPNDGGAALKTAFSTAMAGKEVGTFENLEDDKVKH